MLKYVEHVNRNLVRSLRY